MAIIRDQRTPTIGGRLSPVLSAAGAIVGWQVAILCPFCRKPHVFSERADGFYVACEGLHVEVSEVERARLIREHRQSPPAAESFTMRTRRGRVGTTTQTGPAWSDPPVPRRAELSDRRKALKSMGPWMR
jgi:hypothetical protein